MNNKFQLCLLFLTIILLIVSCEKEISVSAPQQYEKGNSQLYISTIPKGALIFVDGKNYGQYTPDTVKWLTPGEHVFKLKIDLYLDYSFTEIIEENTKNIYEHNFNTDSANFGAIKFFSNPNYCTVFINDSLQSFTPPYTLHLVWPGKYKVKYTFPEHRADSITVSVSARDTTYCDFTLEDTTIFVTYKTKNSLIPDNSIHSVLVDDDNNIWIGTRYGVLVKKNDNREFLNTFLPNNMIFKIKKDKQNNIWVATNTGLAKFSNNITTVYNNDNSGLLDYVVNDFDFDASGNAWIGTWSAGLVKFDGIDNWTVYNTSNSSIPANYVTAVLIDKTDSLWIGTNAFKTAKFDYKNKWTTFQSEQNAPSDHVITLSVDINNTIWVGLSGSPPSKNSSGRIGGLYTISNNIMSRANLSIPYEDIFNIYFEDENTVWVGTSVGLYSATLNGDFTLRYSGWINASYKDQNGNLWIATNDRGLVKYKKWKE